MTTVLPEVERPKVRLIIAGSRTFTDQAMFDTVTDNLLKQWPKEEVEIVSGMAKKGPDAMAVVYAKKHGYSLKDFPANWDGLGKAAGMIRNADMGNYATHLLVFWDGESHGTAHMLDYAKKKGLQRYQVFFDRHDQPAPPYLPAYKAERIENNRIVEGRAIFREEATLFNQLMGRKEFPEDHATIPWEQAIRAVVRARLHQESGPLPIKNSRVLYAFMNFVEEHMLYITAERLPLLVTDPPTVSSQKV